MDSIITVTYFEVLDPPYIVFLRDCDDGDSCGKD